MNKVIKMPTPAEPPAFELSYVHGPSIANIWPVFAPMLAPALEDVTTLQDVFEQIYNGHAVLWVVCQDGAEPKAVLVARKRANGPEETALEVVATGGSAFSEWSPMVQEALERIMRDTGCSLMRATCRRGMAKWLKDLNWRERYIVMEWRDGQ